MFRGCAGVLAVEFLRHLLRLPSKLVNGVSVNPPVSVCDRGIQAGVVDFVGFLVVVKWILGLTGKTAKLSRLRWCREGRFRSA